MHRSRFGRRDLVLGVVAVVVFGAAVITVTWIRNDAAEQRRLYDGAKSDFDGLVVDVGVVKNDLGQKLAEAENLLSETGADAVTDGAVLEELRATVEAAKELNTDIPEVAGSVDEVRAQIGQVVASRAEMEEMIAQLEEAMEKVTKSKEEKAAQVAAEEKKRQEEEAKKQQATQSSGSAKSGGSSKSSGSTGSSGNGSAGSGSVGTKLEVDVTSFYNTIVAYAASRGYSRSGSGMYMYREGNYATEFTDGRTKILFNYSATGFIYYINQGQLDRYRTWVAGTTVAAAKAAFDKSWPY